MSHATRRVGVDGIARVEGEGSLRVELRDGAVTEVSLDIFEPPRFFEALLVGRDFAEAPDITARVCGICPVAYQMSACAAMEDALGVEVDEAVWRLRRLLYCGEWIQSHALHVYLLNAPDFLGLADGVELAERDRASVERGLDLKKTGNLIMETVGGRSIHPVNVRVGGFYAAPSRADVAALAEPLARARDAALATVAWVAAFERPVVPGDYLFVALRDERGYAIERGAPTTSDDRSFSAAGFGAAIAEEHVARSTALHSRLGGAPYLTGPLARFSINADRLGAIAAQAARAAGLVAPVTNPYDAIVVRAVELVEACDEALRLVASYEPPDPPAAPVAARAGAGSGVTEAPRGLLLQQYELGADGLITRARLVPPTSQNQLSIEADLARVALAHADDPDEALATACEAAVRNHDPCISCAAHFLDVTVVRS